ncbi:hypothetical protein AC482_06785 [miscellaneous Crenarchaeota group-15 archaeon DG-45]|uniref:Flavin reductase like domain-containing protein n=1 Tax=miscellaneous Crenarchaeota group-15 archaeon DG-45 TaxID=1685127 RepID=A0A0M0BLU9_9ARCH|nr:MAG: hypothetical protein AC482_06785 [miscellaneous Crenarchaeota group-15 archaeon DG-45]
MKLDLREFYKLLVRPTVVVSTISPDGASNAAPFSWNAPMATSPVPLFGFSSSVSHDTWRNIRENGEFVVNLVGESFGPLMEVMERDLPYGVSEIGECGLTEARAHRVKPPRIEEAYGWLECVMTDHFPISDRTVWVVGRVLEAEARDEALDEVVDVEAARPLNHIRGEFFVTEMKIRRFRRA